ALGEALLAYMHAAGQPEQLVIGPASPPWPGRPAQASTPLVTAERPAAGPHLGVRHEAPDEWDPADPDPYRRYGNAVHAALARVRTVADVRPAMEHAVAMGAIGAGAAAQLVDRLTDLLGSPALAPWFGAGLAVRTEATIIAADGRALRPDRVVIDPPAVRVLDIKTGHRADGHHHQVRTYMELLGAMGHATVEGALLYLPEGLLVPVEP
ncbi:MAG: hypothetical protein RBT71_12810, partial [Flavobacteriales bacterium]|nr:hypothetical protein [Flavobacteriales bacterium]